MFPGFSGHLVSEVFLEQLLKHTVANSEAAERCRQSLRGWHRRCATLGPASNLRAVLDVGAAPLTRALGFEPPQDVVSVKNGLTASLRTPSGVAALLVTPWAEPLDWFWRVAVSDARRRSARWCVLFNGVAIRLVDGAQLYSRRYVEFDLALTLDLPDTFAALWSVMRAEVTTHPARLSALVAESDRHSTAVSRSLRSGVLSASHDILAALVASRKQSRRTTSTQPDNAFEQALTIVYRILFLLFAEARSLVPLWHPVYRESYSVEALCDAAALSSHPAGAWDTLRAIARLAHTGCRAGELRVTPFNGRLFAPAQTPLADRQGLDDEAARRAVVALSTQPAADGAGRERIAYRDLGVEQLGAVYETLLDYEPRVARNEQGHVSIALERGAGVRKETGTFYTPRPLADYLVRRTLAPLTDHATPQRILSLRIVDPAMGSGAFLVAACRFLATAYEAALVRTGGCHPSDFDESERTRIRRLIAERCLYGVDLNPMAVQLARLSLWLATLAAERPLTFLDHRLRVGDSLLGAWLTNLRQLPLARKRAAESAGLPLFEESAIRRVMTGVLPVRFRLELTPDDTLDQVREKERAHAAMIGRGTVLSNWKRVADLWCATWFAANSGDLPRTAFSSLSDAIHADTNMLPSRTVDRYLATAEDLAGRRRFFHWELEFPEVFFEAGGERRSDGGFDAVIGNPPWDMVRADAGPAHARSRARLAAGAIVRFTRDAGVYSTQSDGHANRYQLFLERAMDLVRKDGRLGLVLPAGFATDSGSARLRRRLASTSDIDSIVGFDNHSGAFPIHRSVRFLLATATAGAPTRTISCRFGESQVSALETTECDAPSWYPVRLTPAFLERVSGEDLAIPWMKSAIDQAIVERATTLFGPLGEHGGWGVRFGRELNVSDDRDAFKPPRRGLPIVEGKQLSPFRVDLDSARYSISAGDALHRLRDRRFAAPRLAYRDVASATNRLTLIAAILPGGCVSTHTVFCLRSPMPLTAQHLLCGLFNSFVVNYLVRMRVSAHVTTGIVERLPVPRALHAPRACHEIAAIARFLARGADFDAWAMLQARVAQLYQMSRDEFAHVLESFPLIPKGERDLAFQTFATGTRG